MSHYITLPSLFPRTSIEGTISELRTLSPFTSTERSTLIQVVQQSHREIILNGGLLARCLLHCIQLRSGRTLFLLLLIGKHAKDGIAISSDLKKIINRYRHFCKNIL